ncbi:MAG: cell division protein FtsQ/DivIB [Elainellaceae cyanobacterium]
MVRLHPSHLQLVKRRRRLRRERRLRILRSLWRFLVVSALTAATIWTVSLPGWVLRSPDQIAVSGNGFLAAETVQMLLPIDYPRSILQVRPKQLATALKTRGPIAEATVKRQILPPGLKVHIREQRPVALLLGRTDLKTALGNDASSAPTGGGLTLQPTGLLDETGTLIPIARYNTVSQDLELPTLKLIGMRQHYRELWASLYRRAKQSPVEITEVDLRNPANIVLKSSLGEVHIGGYEAERFVQQLKTLDQMRNLPQTIPLSELQYIDLTSSSPFLQMQPSAADGDDSAMEPGTFDPNGL